MTWKDEVSGKLKRKNQILFSKDCELLVDLNLLLGEQNRRVIALWAFDLTRETVEYLESKYPSETRPREALETAEAWARGKIKMPFAKRKILDCHALAKELESKEDIALCHAVGQACSVVHTVGHALGYPIYELTATVNKYGIENCEEKVEKRKDEYIKKLLYWKEHIDGEERTWANFMLK